MEEFNSEFKDYEIEVEEYENKKYLQLTDKNHFVHLEVEIQDPESQEEALRSFVAEAAEEYPYHYDMYIKEAYEWICSYLNIVPLNKRNRNYEFSGTLGLLINWAKEVVYTKYLDVYPSCYSELTKWVVSSLEEAKNMKEKIAIAAVFSTSSTKYGLYYPECGTGQFFTPSNYDVCCSFKRAEKNLKKGCVKIACFDEEWKRFTVTVDSMYRTHEEYDSQKRIVLFRDNCGKEIHYAYDNEGNRYYSRNSFFDKWYNSNNQIVKDDFGYVYTYFQEYPEYGIKRKENNSENYSIIHNEVEIFRKKGNCYTTWYDNGYLESEVGTYKSGAKYLYFYFKEYKSTVCYSEEYNSNNKLKYVEHSVHIPNTNIVLNRRSEDGIKWKVTDYEMVNNGYYED